jgi:PAS domain S-box-containing protein
MKIYEYEPGMYIYRYLPTFAKYLIDNHLDDFVSDQLAFSRKINIPLLKYLAHYSEEEILQISRATTAEYLGFLAANKAREQLVNSFTKWYGDKLDVIGKFDINVEDITALNYVRGRTMKKWARTYDLPMNEKYELLDEIDNLLFASTASSTNTFIDILETKIQEESHFNEHLINASPGIIFNFDLVHQREIYVNGNVKEIMGFSPDEVLAFGDKLLTELTHPDDIDNVVLMIQKMMNEREGKTHQLEYRFKDRSGNYKWIRSYLIVFKRDEKGKPTEVLGTSFEVTAEKDTALALEKRESQLLEAQSIAQLGSFEWDLENDKSINTPELNKIFEFHTQQAHHEFMDNVHPEDKQRVRSSITQSFITGNYDCQYRYIAHSGEKYLWTRGVVLFKDRKPIIMRGTVQDITQLKRIENELMIKTKELERSNESLQQFASIASHDLKEPLRKMSMYTDMVMTTEVGISDSSKTNLEKVKASSIRMQNMIEDILHYSSITGNEQKEQTNLGKVIAEALVILQETIEEKNATIKYNNLPDALVIPSQMRQMFQNLIGNAIKFSRPDIAPVINIEAEIKHRADIDSESVERSDSYVVIRVSDNGIGFRQDYADKIFGLFTRLHGRSAYEGSGLGLSICKRIAENHGGKITAFSEPGNGAVFEITIPR